MSRFIYLVGILLIVGFIFSLHAPAPRIFGLATAPIQDGELWHLNAP